jgi:CheY-like chemotaxis protein
VLRYTVKSQTNELAIVNPVVTQLTERMGWKVEQEDHPASQRIVTLHIASHGPTVLVVDDNEGLVELLGRYLSDHACRVTAALSGQEGLRLAQELVPDAIILDVMMPEMDGWEFLQRLRARPETADIPIIICSVFNDPELAYSLGASLYLPKPVSRDRILSALHQLGVV